MQSFKSYILLVLTISLVLASCSKENKNGDTQVREISVEEEEGMVPSQWFNKFHCVQLEMNDDCLISDIAQLEDIDGIVVIRTTDDHIFTFDKTTGKFINAIGEKGEGPNEYLRPLSFSVTSDKQLAITDDLKGCVLRYTMEGKFVGSSKIEIPSANANTTALTYDCYLLEENCLNSTQNGGKANSEYSVIDLKTGKSVKEFGSYSPLRLHEYVNRITASPMAKCGNTVSFIKAYCDTIFHYNSIKDIAPAFKLKLEKGMVGRETVASWEGTDVDIKPIELARKGKNTGLVKIFETKRTILLVSSLSSLYEGYIWIDKQSWKGYHVPVSKDEAAAMIEGKTTIGEIGSNEKEMIFYLNQKNISLLKDAFRSGSQLKPLSQELKKVVENADVEGNPVLVFYEH